MNKQELAKELLEVAKTATFDAEKGILRAAAQIVTELAEKLERDKAQEASRSALEHHENEPDIDIY